jgi:thioredoxin 1
MATPILTLEEAIQAANNSAALLYFSSPMCNVCEVLKPKVFSAVEVYFEKIECYEVNIANTPEIGVHFNVLAAPTVIIFLNGKEFVREYRAFSVEGMLAKIERPYDILFS